MKPSVSCVTLLVILLAEGRLAGSKSRSQYKYKSKGKGKGNSEEKQQLTIINLQPPQSQQAQQPQYRPYYVPYHMPRPHYPPQRPYQAPAVQQKTKTVYVPVVKTVKVPVIIREKVHYVHTHHKASPHPKAPSSSYRNQNTYTSPNSYSNRNSYSSYDKNKFHRRTSATRTSFDGVETLLGGNSFEREFVTAYLKSKNSGYSGRY